MAEELSQGIDALDQLVRTAQLTVGKLWDQHVRLQTVVVTFEHFVTARIAAPKQVGPLREQLDVSATRTTGVQPLAPPQQLSFLPLSHSLLLYHTSLSL